MVEIPTKEKPEKIIVPWCFLRALKAEGRILGRGSADRKNAANIGFTFDPLCEKSFLHCPRSNINPKHSDERSSFFSVLHLSNHLWRPPTTLTTTASAFEVFNGEFVNIMLKNGSVDVELPEGPNRLKPRKTTDPGYFWLAKKRIQKGPLWLRFGIL